MEHDSQISAGRLRWGVVMLVLWWIPVWAAVPTLCALLGIHDSTSQRRLLLLVLAIQTIVGLLGAWLAGKEVITVVRGIPRRRMPGAVWRVFIHGRIEPKSDQT
jgi:hypothetical protein